jgi:hypothetical protein
VPTSTEENHPLDSAAPAATVLDYIAALSGTGVAFLNLHGLFANDAVKEIDQRAFVVVRWGSYSPRPAHFPFAFSPASRARRSAFRRLRFA